MDVLLLRGIGCKCKASLRRRISRVSPGEGHLRCAGMGAAVRLWTGICHPGIRACGAFRRVRSLLSAIETGEYS